MADNSLVTPRMITFKCLDEFMNNLKVLSGFNTTWEKDFGKKGMKIGDTELIRKPQRWIVKRGMAYQSQPIQDTYATLTIDRNGQIGFDWGAFEEVLSIDDVYERYFRTSINQLSNDADDQASQYGYLNCNNISGKLGTDPASLADSQSLFLSALATLQEKGCPPDDLTAVLAPRQAAAVIQYFNTNYNPQGALAEQFRSGRLMSQLLGFAQASIDQNIWKHTCGVFVGTPAVQTASVNGDTAIVVNGWTTGDILNPGDVFSIGTTAGTKIYAVNPKNRRAQAQMTFGVGGGVPITESGGSMTIPLAGGMVLYDSSQQYANIDNLPAAGSLLTIFPGTTTPSGLTGSNGLAFGRQAYGFVSIELPKMDGCGIAEVVTDPKTKISIALHRGSDIRTYERISRVDWAGGFVALYPDNEAVRLLGA